MAVSPFHGSIPIPQPCHTPTASPALCTPSWHTGGAPTAHPAPRPPRAGAQPLSLPAAEPGLECHPLQEHFGHVPRRFTSSPHLRHGAHHPAAAGPLRHQLFHFTQRGAHPQEELGEVLHPDILRWASPRGPGDRHPPRVRYRGPSPFPCPLFVPLPGRTCTESRVLQKRRRPAALHVRLAHPAGECSPAPCWFSSCSQNLAVGKLPSPCLLGTVGAKGSPQGPLPKP